MEMENINNELKKDKRRNIFIVMFIFILLMLIAGTTYALFLVSNSKSGSISGSANCYTINYTKGQDIAGELVTGTDYSSGWSTGIVMYTNSGCENLTGTLYITTNASSTMDFSDNALKYTVLLGSTVVSTGSIDGTANQIIYDNFALNTSSTTYTVYIWLDEALEDTTNYNNESYSGFIHADVMETSNLVIADDISNNSKDASIYGATFTSEGLVFDGTNDYVLLPDNLGVTYPATLSIKFKTNSTANQIIFGDYDTGMALGIYNSGTSFIVTNGDGSIRVPIYSTGIGTLKTNTFYTVDLVYNSRTDIKAYLNGTALSTTGSDNYWTWYDTNNYIGKRADRDYFNGTIERIMLYNDALTTSEISSNLAVTNAQVGGSGIVSDNLALYYNFKASVRDLSGNINNGIMYGATLTSGGLNFNGSSNYVLLPESIGATLPATYSVTFKTNSTANQIIFGDYDTGASLGIYDSNGDGNGESFIVINGDGSVRAPTFSIGGTIKTNTFYTVDLVYTSLTDIDVYLDGKLLSANGDNYWTWLDTNNYIGKRSSGNYFNGSISRFIVYDDMLTQAEITYNLGVKNKKVCGTGIICDNLKLYYSF